MDTNRIKRFATEARNILMQGVSQRFITLGFNPDGTVKEEPTAYDGGATFMGEIVSLDFYNKWKSLQEAVNKKTTNEVAEEAAYTWFNRLVAIRIMAKNKLIAPVLEYVSDEDHIPIIVSEARQGRMPQMNVQSQDKLNELLDNDALTSEQFSILIVAYCHDNPVINKCFGTISDYTELLLPANILNDGGFVDTLNHTDYISEQDFHSPELIGWLYQFYISEKKDDVFASFKKGQKAEAKDIPAATQIFTPNWIVKYMVQNTIGRIYLDNNPYSDIKDDMQYLVENESSKDKANIYQFDDIHELTCADLACGSGHILNEIFDLLYKCYIEEGYNRRQAIEDIFRYNLTGIDLDTRAKQLSQFALLLKACQKDTSFADGHSMPRVLDMPKPYTDKEHLAANLAEFIMAKNQEVIEELYDAIMLMDEAQNLGSIMKFNISERTRNMLSVRLAEYEQENFLSEVIKGLIPYIKVILCLSHKYSALVMNPPYMGGGNMNTTLSKYVKDNYEDGKADLATVFVEMMPQRLTAKGKYAFIIPPSWMFLSTFENLRKRIIEHNKIDSLLHLSRGVFGADFGTSSAVMSNYQISDNDKGGVYLRLVERTFQEFDQKHLQMLFEQTLANHDFKYCFKDYNKDIIELPHSEHGNKIYYSNVSQNNFEKIPGCPIGYWVSERMIEAFQRKKIKDICIAVKGLDTCDNNTYIRFWPEISRFKIGFNINDINETYQHKWYPYCKGGGSRKWYGLYEMLVNWENNGIILRNLRDDNGKIKSRPQNIKYYFKGGITWSSISSSNIALRCMNNAIFGGGGSAMFSQELIMNIFSLLNSKVGGYLLKILNPTLNFLVGDLLTLPIAGIENLNLSLVQNSISISQQDWDAHETSWDFKQNELISLNHKDAYISVMNEWADFKGLMLEPKAPQIGNLEWLVQTYKTKWETKFMQLHANEEELNRQFIEIYGLQDELTPDVPLDKITILQQGEISIDNDKIVWHYDVVIKQLISYAVACIMGRYSIDCDGLILASQGEGIKEYEDRVPNSSFEIDDDGIIPLMPSNTDFTDVATKRMKTWLTVAFGEENLVDNLNFIEKCLGKSLDQYFVKDFWKDHKKMYQNRPIYWLFSSKKGAFQCIAYMHRMNPYTAEFIRTKYLLPHIEWLINKQNEMQVNYASLSSTERKELDSIVKQIAECREYHDRLHLIADQQIAFDLDDGVVVNYAKFGDVLSKLK